MIFRQLFDPETWTYTYLIGDPSTKEAVFIDPVNTFVETYLELLNEHGLKLKYSLETHVHADHVTASGILRQRTGAATGVSQLCGAQGASMQLQDGQELFFGANEKITVIATPGHTAGSISFLWRDRLFTGDALFINGCGRTDFQSGNPGQLYDVITQRLFTLPGETLVYPGHDYNKRWVSSIEQERTTNVRLAGKTREEFIDIMNNLNLPKPRLIDQAVPANRWCGVTEEQARQDAVSVASTGAATEQKATPVAQTERAPVLTPQELVKAARQQVKEIDVAAAEAKVDDAKTVIVDVREPDEYAAGHLPRAINIPRGVLEFRLGSVPELGNPSADILLYCRSGGRSALAALSLARLGYTATTSLSGGYDAWQAQQSANAQQASKSAAQCGV